jgi:alpha-ribazole phosphatase/probable phosphoglycerate mutase
MAAVSVSTRLVLCRHGEPEVAFRGRCYGRLDVGLSPRGLRQADALAARLAGLPLAAVYSSPARRALQTAHPVASTHELSPIAHAALHELDFGDLEGLPYEEIAARHPELYAAWMGEPTRVRFPDGESYSELRARVLAAVAELLERHRGAAFAAVSHGGPIRAVLASCLGIADEAVFRLDQHHGAISVVDWIGDAPLVRVVNADPVSCLPLFAAPVADER